jgi:hypothetical protein
LQQLLEEERLQQQGQGQGQDWNQTAASQSNSRCCRNTLCAFVIPCVLFIACLVHLRVAS